MDIEINFNIFEQRSRNYRQRCLAQAGGNKKGQTELAFFILIVVSP